MEQDLSQGSVIRRVLGFALPLALGMGSHALFNLCDLWIVGRLGEAEVAGVHLAGTINFLPMILGNGLSVAGVALISGRWSRGEIPEARRMADLSFWLLLVSGLLLGAGAWFLAGPAIDLQGPVGASRGIGIAYLEVVSLGTFTMFLLMHVTGVMRAFGNAFWPVALMIGSNVLNLVLDVVLIFGVPGLGIPAMGAVGAAWATVLARFAGGVAGLILLSRRSSPIRPSFRLPRLGSGLGRRMLALGGPQSMQMLLRAFLVVVTTRIAGELGGEGAQAALGIVTRLDTLILFAAVGWAGGATAMVGQCRALDRPLRCLRMTAVTTLLASGGALLLASLFAVFSRPLLLLFVPSASPALLEVGGLYLGILAFAHPAATASLVLAGAVNGAARSLPPMLLDLLVLGVLLAGLSVWFLLGAPYGLPFCFAMVLLGQWALLLAYLLWMRRGEWVEGRFPAKASRREPAC